tara:strand:- start:99 stop:500 length:402 start_codon:yes stop_codon:yes gene_type:complete
MATLTEPIRDLLDSPTFWFLGTINPDGRPQVNPMWIDREGEYIVLNTAIGRQKEKNLRRDPRVTLSLTEPENPYNFIEIRGEVTEYIEGEEADAQINWLAQKYVGEETYPWRKPGELRVKMLVKPTYVYHLIR